MYLIPYFYINPVALEIGAFSIRWYGIAYVVGIILGWAYLSYLIGKGKFRLTKKTIDDFIPWVVLGIVGGGRLGQALFYQFDYYLHHPLEIFFIWRPGMSFHGGVLGVLLAIILYSRAKKISLLHLGDAVSAALPIGLFFGRVANYINAELVGTITDVPWATIFPGAGPFPRHPSQLYEAFLEGILLFLIGLGLILFKNAPRKNPGLVWGVFSIGYGITRSFVEIFREPEIATGYMMGGTTLGQWLSFPLIIFGLIICVYSLKNPANDKRP